MAKKYTIELPSDIEQDIYDAYDWYSSKPDGVTDAEHFMAVTENFVQDIYEAYTINKGEETVDTGADTAKDTIEVETKNKAKEIKVKE